MILRAFRAIARVPSSLRPVFGPSAELDKDALYSEAQVQEALLGYREQQHLAASHGCIKLDRSPVLAPSCMVSAVLMPSKRRECLVAASHGCIKLDRSPVLAPSCMVSPVLMPSKRRECLVAASGGCIKLDRSPLWPLHAWCFLSRCLPRGMNSIGSIIPRSALQVQRRLCL